ncbi:ribonuclease III [Shrimp hemocyte iridescent virus]|uniref:Ribonuclease III n=1 Tax=Shrimp hemocyte iridescent virus TaxID=2039780 RepID=A0A291B0N7_9VIRU|nr:ribonuclease III [Shrimp hemocyte iridescent virus]ATE87056.1 ribonuclease III [Shrimp hemocyte iridescent virus]
MDVTQDFIEKTFKDANINPKYFSILTNQEALKIYNTAFTAATVDPEKNYELYEFIGDVAAGHALVTYFYNTFPQLRSPKHINILNRLKIVHGSRESFSKIAEDLGFEKYIKYAKNNETPYTKKTREALLEDTFEAFLGATQIILENEFGKVGVAVQIIYDFIKSIFDKKEISFEPSDLYDAKTRLKELFDNHANTNQLFTNFGVPKYVDVPHGTESTLTFTKLPVSFQGKENTKQKSQKSAAQKALDYFEKLGYNTKKKFNTIFSK